MEKKIKVLEFVDTYYPKIDGVINVVGNYCKELNKVADCTLVAPKADRKENFKDDDEFRVLRCKSMKAPEKYRLALPGLDDRLRRTLKADTFEIIHTHTPFTLGSLAVRIGKRKKVPVVATLHTKYYDDFLRATKSKLISRLYLKYVMQVYKKADSVWTVTEANKETLRQYGYKGDIEVVRNGTDFVYPENAKELSDSIDKLHGLSGQKNVFLFVGRMATYKNLKLLCDSLRILKGTGADFVMLFVGGGFDLDKFKKYATKIGISDRCVFTGEVKDRRLLQAYYLRSDLFLFPSVFDTSGIVTIEAAAHKKASVLTKNSCSAELAQDGVNGFLCEENAESYAEKLEYLCANPELCAQAGENAYKTLYRTWDDVAEEVLRKYKEIIEKYKSDKHAE